MVTPRSVRVSKLDSQTVVSGFDSTCAKSKLNLVINYVIFKRKVCEWSDVD